MKTKVEFNTVGPSLFIPKPEFLTLDIGKRACYDKSGFAAIQKVWAAAQSMANNIILMKKLQHMADETIKLDIKIIDQNNTIITAYRLERMELAEVRHAEIDEHKSQIHKSKVKIAFYAIGGLLIGAGIGLAIGFLAPIAN